MEQHKILFKDMEINKTIDKIRSIFTGLNIEVQETFLEPAKGMYSVTLAIKNANLRTNGKGVTKEAALASAYAEMMERMQNYALYKFTFPVNELVKTGFYYYPDEQYISIDKMDEYVAIFQEGLKLKIEDVIELHTEYERDNKVVAVIPYMDCLHNKKMLVPARLLELIYASNGMASGNTLEEALVQAVSELFERYANKEICYGNMIPPSIPEEALQLTEQSKQILSEMSKNTSYSISFRDCSLGMGLPVVGLYFINRDSGKYFVKFGAHPVMSVAIERTLTELFQGRRLDLSEFWLKSFTFDDISNTVRNFDKIFRSGDGEYPYRIFEGKASYSFENIWYPEKFDGNVKLLSYMVDIVEKNNWTLLYKNVGFLGMPSVHAFIPEISTISCVDENYLKKSLAYKHIKKLVRNVKNSTREEKQEILDFIERGFYAAYDSISPMYGLPLKSEAPVIKCNVEYFKFMLHFMMEEYNKALKALDTFIDISGFKNSRKGCYYRCVRETFNSLFIRRIPREEAVIILKDFYGTENVDKALLEISNMQEKLEELSYNCYDCTNCKNKEYCYYSAIMQFHEKIAKECVKSLGIWD